MNGRINSIEKGRYNRYNKSIGSSSKSVFYKVQKKNPILVE